MPRIQILITINTDPVLGKYHEADDFLNTFSNVVGWFPNSYNGKAELVHPNLDGNCRTYFSIISELGIQDAERFMLWAGSRYFEYEGAMCFWNTDYYEWMNTREG